jgi:hypothetical protein
MGFPRRLMLFMFGAAMGTVLVYGMLIRDREFPAWTPSDRIKEEITWDSIHVDASLNLELNQAAIVNAVNGSNIHFDKSKVRTKPCRTYLMTTEDLHDMTISICDSVATVLAYD